MLIMCNLSYQDGEAIEHMKQNAINPTQRKYGPNATETLMIDNRNVNSPSSCCNSPIGGLCQLSYCHLSYQPVLIFVDKW